MSTRPAVYETTADTPTAPADAADGASANRVAPASVLRRPGSSAGERLATAFADIERFPAPVALRDRVVSIASGDPFDPDAFAAAAGADLGLTLAILRRASSAAEAGTEVASVGAAIEVLGPSGLVEVCSSVPTYDPLSFSEWSEHSMQRSRSHAVQVRNCAVEITRLVGGADPEEVSAAALMHDLGRLVVTRLHPDYDPEQEFAAITPEKRLKRERRLYGIDHTLVGGVLARRWDLPERTATAIERHHREDASGVAAIICLADQITHHQVGDAVSLDSLRRAASSLGLPEFELRRILSGPELPDSGGLRREGSVCPLSERELNALALLAEGKVYKQIAERMEVSVSTIRSHLHNVYGKLGVVDRAQAVLKAREQGWL